MVKNDGQWKSGVLSGFRESMSYGSMYHQQAKFQATVPVPKQLQKLKPDTGMLTR